MHLGQRSFVRVSLSSTTDSVPKRETLLTTTPLMPRICLTREVARTGPISLIRWYCNSIFRTRKPCAFLLSLFQTRKSRSCWNYSPGQGLHMSVKRAAESSDSAGCDPGHTLAHFAEVPTMPRPQQSLLRSTELGLT